MLSRLRSSGLRWRYFCLLAILLATAGAGWEWRQGQFKHQVKTVHSTVVVAPDHTLLRPNSLHSLSAFPVGPNGPLESPNRKSARIAEEARIKTRLLVRPDRSNVDCAQMKCLALTYDDGPEPRLTHQLLNILRERQAVATFFVVGSRIPRHEGTLKRMVREQHEIGNHTWSHKKLPYLADPDITLELSQTSDAIAAATGRRPRIMRPPMGEYDARVAAAVHMPLVFWTVDPRDWRDRDVGLIYQRAIQAADQGRIILLHDTYATSVQASVYIIDELQRQGYVLVTVSELFDITDENVSAFVGQILRFR